MSDIRWPAGQHRVPGDYSAEDTPLPISNREVKLRSADGTSLPLEE